MEPETFLAPPIAVGTLIDEQVLSLAFSPDGKKLGGLFHHFGLGTQVFWWDLATGVRSAGYKVDGLFFSAFQWSEDGAAVLVNRSVVLDAETGKLLWTVQPQSNTPRRLLSADRVLSVEGVMNGQIFETGFFVLTRP